VNTSALDAAVYDPGSRMLRAFLDRLPRHLEPGGEAWADPVGLRRAGRSSHARGAAAPDRPGGMKVAGRLGTTARHHWALDPTDPLHALRAAEVTSLWRLRVR
jgi:hypothetical protein